MTARVDLFCSLNEEWGIIEYMLKDDSVCMYTVDSEGSMVLTKRDELHVLQQATGPLCVFFHLVLGGDLVWHHSKPNYNFDERHGRFLADYFAHRQWEDAVISDGQKMLDIERSPVIQYDRGKAYNGRTLANTLIAPPSSLKHISSEYERWVKRVFSWVRRKGENIHDYRKPSETIPWTTLNTVYAFPDVLDHVNSGNHTYAIGHFDR